MSWDGTYSHSVLIGLDQFAAAVIFNRNDVTVSALCRVMQLADAGAPEFNARLDGLKLSHWQIWLLRKLAIALDRLQPGHCESARIADLVRAQSCWWLLSLPGTGTLAPITPGQNSQ